MNVPDFWYQLEWRDLRRSQREERRRDLVGLRSEIDEVRERIEQMATLNRALWEILREELGVTDERLSEQLQALVARRVAAGPDAGKTCASCGRNVPASRRHCLYCGVGFE